MIIGLIGDFVLHKAHEEWISDKIKTVIKRGLDKNAQFMIISHSGWDMAKHMNGIEHYVVTHWDGYISSSAMCTFNASIEFFVDMCDLIVIISNGDTHSVWDYVREQPCKRIEINYLSKKETLYKGEIL